MHKTSLGDLIETLFLFNLTILAYGTSYVREIKGNQYILANFSMSIAFILFLTIVCFHTHKYVLKKTNVWLKVINCFKSKRMMMDLNLKKKNQQIINIMHAQKLFDF